MRIIVAGAAAIALAASGAYAQGNGKGNGGGNKHAAGQAKGNGNSGKKADHGPDRQEKGQRAQKKGNGRDNRDRDWEGRPAQAQNDKRGNGRRDERSERSYDDRRADRADRREVRVRYDDRDRRDGRRIVRGERDTRWLVQDRDRTLIDGCPPGLAKKRNGCNPPGQVKDRYQRNLFGYDYRPSLFGLTNYDRRGDYYYNDGYLVRYGDRGVSSWIPLLGGALGIGNVWPRGYESYRVPDYYVDYYNLGSPDRYRYADNVIYRVAPEDAAITSIAALITGDDFRIGQAMPRGYDVYNVPHAYRDRYYDTPDYMYRYSDGYVYQIDPETRLVAAAIELLI